MLGFILALILNNKFKGRKIARAIIVFPWATTLVIQASVWKFIINTDYGTLNTLLKTLGIIEKNINWTPTDVYKRQLIERENVRDSMK